MEVTDTWSYSDYQYMSQVLRPDRWGAIIICLETRSDN